MGKHFIQAFDGDRIIPEMTGYKLACCDCGLVHDINFQIIRITNMQKNGNFTPEPVPDESLQVVYTPVRNNLSTAMKRRWMRAKGWEGVK